MVVCYRIKYPAARQVAFLSNMKVTVSTADFLCSNSVLKDMTTYLPSGAPGRVLASWDLTVRRLISRPSGLWTAFREAAHRCSGTAFWK